MNTSKRPVTEWLDFLLMGAGFWLLFSPAFLHFNSEKPENWLAVLMGAIVVALAFSLRSAFRVWETGLAGLAGVILLALPWVAGFHAGPKVTVSMVICGIITAATAAGRWYLYSRGLGKGPTAPTAA